MSKNNRGSIREKWEVIPSSRERGLKPYCEGSRNCTTGARVTFYLHAKESQLYADILQRLVESRRFVV